MINAKDLADIISAHLLDLTQCSMDNAVLVNMCLAKHFLLEVAQRTIRLNGTTVLAACKLAQVYVKTSKPIDSIVRTMWSHLTKKSQNKSASGYENLHQVEAMILQTWDGLRAKPIIKKEKASGKAPAMASAPMPEDNVKKEVVVKQEVVTKQEIPSVGGESCAKPVIKQEIPSAGGESFAKPVIKQEIPSAGGESCAKPVIKSGGHSSGVAQAEAPDTSATGAMVVSTNLLDQTAVVYLPGSGKMQKVPLVHGPGQMWCAQTSPGVLVPTGLQCSDDAEPQALQDMEAMEEEQEEKGPGDDAPKEVVQEDPGMEEEQEQEGPGDAATMCVQERVSMHDQDDVGEDVAGAGDVGMEVDDKPNGNVIEILASSEDDEESVGTKTPFPRTPATMVTYSVEYGSPYQWASGMLHPDPADDIDLTASEDEDAGQVVQQDVVAAQGVQAPAVVVHDESVPGIPEEVQALRRTLLQAIDERTIKIPTHRLSVKTARAALQRYRLVYKPGQGPACLSARSGPSCSYMTYRVMYYKRGHSIALRQQRSPKQQVGSAKIPAGMSVAHARWVAQQVRLLFLEKDNSWDSYSSDLLGQLLNSA